MTTIAEPIRSWLFAPGHDEKLLGKVFDAGADQVLLDLEDAMPPHIEDAVPQHIEDRAREMVALVAAAKPCWVRVNRARSEECEPDLAALASKVSGLSIPKVESAAEVARIAERASGVPLDWMIESARGVLAAFEIVSAPACTLLSYGGIDLATDLGISEGERETLYARSNLVIAARSAGKPKPSDGVCTLLDDDDGSRTETKAAKRLGFFDKSAIHPRQVPIIHEVFAPTTEELEWAKQAMWAFEQSGGTATKTATGEFVDRPVAERARQILGL